MTSTNDREQLIETFDLTRPLIGEISIPGNNPTLVFREAVAVNGLLKKSTVELSPSTATHVDLPHSMDKWFDSVAPKNPVWQSYPTSRHDRPRWRWTFPCLIVDISSFSDFMTRALRAAGIERLPDRGVEWWRTYEDIHSLLSSLRISAKDLIWTKNFAKHFIIFQTGWRQFAPRDGNLTELVWYPQHPYFLHPYLDLGAAEYLFADEDGPTIPGLGCDLYGLDTPLRYLHVAHNQRQWHEPESQSPTRMRLAKDPTLNPSSENTRRIPPAVGQGLGGLVAGQLQKLTGRGSKVAPTEAPTNDDPEYWPVHTLAFANGKMLLEQLRIPIEAMYPYDNPSPLAATGDSSEPIRESIEGEPIAQFPYRAGTLTLFYFGHSGAEDGLLVSAFFTPKPRS